MTWCWFLCLIFVQWCLCTMQFNIHTTNVYRTTKCNTTVLNRTNVYLIWRSSILSMSLIIKMRLISLGRPSTGRGKQNIGGMYHWMAFTYMYKWRPRDHPGESDLKSELNSKSCGRYLAMLMCMWWMIKQARVVMRWCFRRWRMIGQKLPCTRS